MVPTFSQMRQNALKTRARLRHVFSILCFFISLHLQYRAVWCAQGWSGRGLSLFQLLQNASQLLQRAAKCLKTLENAAKCTPSRRKCGKMLENAVKCCKMHGNVCKMLQTGPKVHQRAPQCIHKAPRCLQNASKCLENAAQCSKKLQNGAKLVENGAKLLQNTSKVLQKAAFWGRFERILAHLGESWNHFPCMLVQLKKKGIPNESESNLYHFDAT